MEKMPGHFGLLSPKPPKTAQNPKNYPLSQKLIRCGTVPFVLKCLACQRTRRASSRKRLPQAIPAAPWVTARVVNCRERTQIVAGSKPKLRDEIQQPKYENMKIRFTSCWSWGDRSRVTPNLKTRQISMLFFLSLALCGCLTGTISARAQGQIMVVGTPSQTNFTVTEGASVTMQYSIYNGLGNTITPVLGAPAVTCVSDDADDAMQYASGSLTPGSGWIGSGNLLPPGGTASFTYNFTLSDAGGPEDGDSGITTCSLNTAPGIFYYQSGTSWIVLSSQNEQLNSFTITVQDVPEPPSSALALLGLAPFTAYALLRRTAKAS
jgi:hypothetical protein